MQEPCVSLSTTSTDKVFVDDVLLNGKSSCKRLVKTGAFANSVLFGFGLLKSPKKRSKKPPSG